MKGTLELMIQNMNFRIHFVLGITINLSDNHYQHSKSLQLCFDSCDSHSLNFLGMVLDLTLNIRSHNKPQVALKSNNTEKEKMTPEKHFKICGH